MRRTLVAPLCSFSVNWFLIDPHPEALSKDYLTRWPGAGCPPTCPPLTLSSRK